MKNSSPYWVPSSLLKTTPNPPQHLLRPSQITSHRLHLSPHRPPLPHVRHSPALTQHPCCSTQTAPPPSIGSISKEGPSRLPSVISPVWMALPGSGSGGATAYSALMSAERGGKVSKRCESFYDVYQERILIGIPQLIPHADVLFLNKHYAQAHSPHYATTPRAFLLSLTTIAPPHALLVAHWGSEGAAVLSLPTKEYFQSSGWVEDRPLLTQNSNSNPSRGREKDRHQSGNTTEVHSVRSGSDFWADGRSRTPSSSAFTAGGSQYMSDIGNDSGMGLSSPSFSRSRSRVRAPEHRGSSSRYHTEDDDDNDSQGTEMPSGDHDADDGVVDEVGAQDAFVAGMIYSLSRRITPGPPYTPSAGGEDTNGSLPESERGRWRLDECLRYVFGVLCYIIRATHCLLQIRDRACGPESSTAKLGRTC